MEWMKRAGLRVEEWALDALARWAQRHDPARREKPAHLQVGIKGEQAALFYLRRKGYIVVARRWSSGETPGDLDLIAWQRQVLCFIEVKTRTAHDMAPAESQVDLHKQATLRRRARAYVRQLPAGVTPPVRMDVVSVYLLRDGQREFVHFQNAFPWYEGRGERD